MANYFFPYCTKHKEVPTCKCGANTICHNCGNGSRTYPCQCTPKIKYTTLPKKKSFDELSFDEVMEEVLEDRSEAWKILANL